MGMVAFTVNKQRAQ